MYYANYLKFIERARTEMMRTIGVDHAALIKNDGLIFVVKAVTIQYHKPAFLDDALHVHSRVKNIGSASLTLSQNIVRGDNLLAESEVVLVCVAKSGHAIGAPCRIPAMIRSKIGSAEDR